MPTPLDQLNFYFEKKIAFCIPQKFKSFTKASRTIAGMVLTLQLHCINTAVSLSCEISFQLVPIIKSILQLSSANYYDLCKVQTWRFYAVLVVFGDSQILWCWTLIHKFFLLIFSSPKTFDVDTVQLNDKYKELQWKLHPDKFSDVSEV